MTTMMTTAQSMTIFLTTMMILICFSGTAVTCLPVMNITGFAWAENILFMPNGVELFASDATTGNIYKITLNEAKNEYVKELWVSEFEGACGFALPNPNDSNTTTFYVAATSKQNKQIGVYVLDSEDSKIVELLGETSYQGNGMSIHYASNTLYFTNEGNEIPGNGWIFAMSSIYTQGVQNNFTTAAQLYSADGCEVDNVNHLLYVSSVAEAKITIYNIDQESGELTKKSSYFAPCIFVDDFTLSSNQQTIYAADYRNRTIVSFNANNGEDGSIIFETPFQPTSVRFGVPPNFNASSLYISMGGGLTRFVNDRGVIQGPSLPIN